MTINQYYSNEKELKIDYINYSYLYSSEPHSCHSGKQKKNSTSANIDDLVQPMWFEKITKLLESNKNKPREPDYQKI